MRTIASGIDTKNPTATAVDTYQLKVLKPQTVAERLSGVFPQARVLVAPNRTVSSWRRRQICPRSKRLLRRSTPRPRLPRRNPGIRPKRSSHAAQRQGGRARGGQRGAERSRIVGKLNVANLMAYKQETAHVLSVVELQRRFRITSTGTLTYYSVDQENVRYLNQTERTVRKLTCMRITRMSNHSIDSELLASSHLVDREVCSTSQFQEAFESYSTRQAALDSL